MSRNVHIPKIEFNYAAPWSWRAWTGIAFWVGYTGIIGFAINGVLGLVLWIAVAGAVTLFFEWLTAVTDDKVRENLLLGLNNPGKVEVFVRGRMLKWKGGSTDARPILIAIFQFAQYAVISFFLLFYLLWVQATPSEGFVFLADMALRPENDLFGLIYRDRSFFQFLASLGASDVLPLAALIAQILTIPLVYYVARLVIECYLKGAWFYWFVLELKERMNLESVLKGYALAGASVLIFGWISIFPLFYRNYFGRHGAQGYGANLDDFFYDFYGALCLLSLAIGISIVMISSLAIKFICFSKKVGPFCPDSGSDQS